jgi:hypothetical protein
MRLLPEHRRRSGKGGMRRRPEEFEMTLRFRFELAITTQTSVRSASHNPDSEDIITNIRFSKCTLNNLH